MITYQFTAPDGTKHLPIELPESRVDLKSSATWAELHAYTPTMTVADKQWLAIFGMRLRKLSCDCASRWRRYVAQNPPDWAHWFEWTVRAHNEVNLRLKKPILSLAQAQAIWQK